MARQIGTDLVVLGDHTVQGTGKGYRFRRSGSALDLEGAGTQLLFSMWANGDFSGLQTNVFIADPDGTCTFQDKPVRSNYTPLVAADLTRKDYVDARVADATNVTSGQFSNARMPQVLSGVRTVNPSAGVIAIDANGVGNNINSTGSSATTLNVPTNGADGQVLQLAIYASTGFTLTFHASFGRLTGIASTLVIATGKTARVAIRRSDVSGSAEWLVESVGVEQ